MMLVLGPLGLVKLVSNKTGTFILEWVYWAPQGSLQRELQKHTPTGAVGWGGGRSGSPLHAPGIIPALPIAGASEFLSSPDIS